MRILSRRPLLAAVAALFLLCGGGALAESRFSFATTPGKLPKDVVPTSYRLLIKPGYANERFEGRAEIEIEVSAFADDKVADELLELTRARLGAGAYYQAEKTADWIRLKASVKAREAERIARWANAQ